MAKPWDFDSYDYKQITMCRYDKQLSYNARKADKKMEW